MGDWQSLQNAGKMGWRQARGVFWNETEMTAPRRHGPWLILARSDVYRDPWIDVTRDDVIRPDGAPGSHCIVRLKPGVSVLAVDDARLAYLTEEFHYAVGRTTIEAVSGALPIFASVAW